VLISLSVPLPTLTNLSHPYMWNTLRENSLYSQPYFFPMYHPRASRAGHGHFPALVDMKLFVIGKKHNYTTQLKTIQNIPQANINIYKTPRE